MDDLMPTYIQKYHLRNYSSSELQKKKKKKKKKKKNEKKKAKYTYYTFLRFTYHNFLFWFGALMDDTSLHIVINTLCCGGFERSTHYLKTPSKYRYI